MVQNQRLERRAVDRKHRVRCGLLHQDFGHTETEVTSASTVPWRQVFALYLKVGDYTLKRHSQAVQPFLPLEYDTPAEWLISAFGRIFPRISFSTALSTGRCISRSGRRWCRRVWIPYRSISTCTGLSTTWRTTNHHDIGLGVSRYIAHHSRAGYGGQLRGRPAVLQQQLGSGQQFCGGGGACVRPCGEALDSGKIQVSSDGSTWSDSTATWSVESAATDFNSANWLLTKRWRRRHCRCRRTTEA